MKKTIENNHDESQLNKSVFDKIKKPFKKLKNFLLKPIDSYQEAKFQENCKITFDKFLNYLQYSKDKYAFEFLQTDIGLAGVYFTPTQGPIIRINLDSIADSSYRVLGFLKDENNHYMFHDCVITKDRDFTNPTDGVYETKVIHKIKGYKMDSPNSKAIKIDETKYSDTSLEQQIAKIREDYLEEISKIEPEKESE